MEILYADQDIVVCIKPARVLSTDEPGGLPELLRRELGSQDFRTVHRLDRVVSGVMVLARNAPAASHLSRQIRENRLRKEYLAVVHGRPEDASGSMRDLLCRDKARKMTLVAPQPGKGVQEAVLDYRVLETLREEALVQILLHTGRTHQIRVQFASRGMPLVGERKYAQLGDPWELALWSYSLDFTHPGTGRDVCFSCPPPCCPPWNQFAAVHSLGSE